MKNLFCILVISFVSLSVSANIEPQAHSQNVLAISGLKLRVTPELSGQLIKVIPFGESITVIEATNISQTIEWMQGEWLKVAYQGLEGYVFDGFISKLPVPNLDFELTQEDLDLTYPLLAWAEYHFDPISNPDTIEGDKYYTLVQHLENGIWLKREDSDYHFKATIILPDTKISEAYNLLRSMLLTKYERNSFVTNSLFISNNLGIIDKIKVDIDSPVEIKQLPDGSVKISVITFLEGCSL